jgi:hypothetical protein
LRCRQAAGKRAKPAFEVLFERGWKAGKAFMMTCEEFTDYRHGLCSLRPPGAIADRNSPWA